jgi:hypothetical protein
MNKPFNCRSSRSKDSCTRRSSIDNVVDFGRVESLEEKYLLDHDLFNLLFVPLNFDSVILFVLFVGTLN